MGIVIGKIELNNEKQIIGELKKKIKGVNFHIAQKVIMLSGNVASIKGNKLIQSEEKQIVDILQRFKGLYSHNYGLKEEALAKIRRIENVYRYIRVRQGYPVRGRTKSNANTVKRQRNVSTGVKTKRKKMYLLNGKPTNRKERKIFNKLKK